MNQDRNQNRSRDNQSISSLIDLGIHGHFPLFHSDWIEQAHSETPSKLTKLEKIIAKKIISKLTKHKSLERKKTSLLSLKHEERQVFVKVFLKMVEGKILDNAPEIH